MWYRQEFNLPLIHSKNNSKYQPMNPWMEIIKWHKRIVQHYAQLMDDNAKSTHVQKLGNNLNRRNENLKAIIIYGFQIIIISMTGLTNASKIS
jgi:hypothetical protein